MCVELVGEGENGSCKHVSHFVERLGLMCLREKESESEVGKLRV